MYNGNTVEESFTRQEYSILTLFLKNPGKVLTRDDIGAVLWGESSYEKYSDWAIDQLMSKLRKKLKEIGVNVEISTLRGRGYKFTQNT
jgi:DNA-binding response OmpR family regulator